MKKRQRGSVLLFSLLLNTAPLAISAAQEQQLADSFPRNASFLEPELVEKLFAREGKEQVTLKNDNVKMTFGGTIKEEFVFAKNATLFNKALPDQANYLRQTFDLTTDIIFGEEKYDHKAIEVFADLRSRALFGSSGKSNPTTSETVKVDGIKIVTGKHSHLATQPLFWLREGWINTSLNAVFGDTEGPFQFLKVGLFPFELGRGIALGSGDTRKDYLGLYSGYENDIQAPGILLSGDIIPDMLKYDLYYAKLEEKSDSFSETMKVIKSNQPNKRLNPFRGIWKDNDLFAFRFQYTPLEESVVGTLNLEPYVFFNYASDRAVEFDGDSRSKLGATGLSVEYVSPDSSFEWGAETAFNFGEENVYQIDRNVSQLAKDSNGFVIEQYSHVVTDQNNTPATLTDDIQQAVKNQTTMLPNGTGFVSLGGVQLYNASSAYDSKNSLLKNRYRPAYTNLYRGCMFITDATYTIKPIDLKIGAVYGYASGDRNPHLEETNKTYKGFVGLLESYSGDRVPSIFVLSTRRLKRPLSLDVAAPNVDTDESFTDLHYAGSGLTWFPWKHKESKFFVRTNVLGYWKASSSPKYDSASQSIQMGTKASRYLGTELNFSTKVELLSNLNYFFDFAAFFPGQFYKDIQGIPLRGDIVKELNLSDEELNQAPNYRIGHDVAYYINTGLTYRF